MENTNEMWKSIAEYEGYYEVSSHGRVRSVDRVTTSGMNCKGRIIKQFSDRKGYMKVRLSKGGETRTFVVHRLVAQAFLLIPRGRYEIHHKDDNKANNHVENLQWVTRSENMVYAYESGVMKKKLSKEDVDFIRKRFKPNSKKYSAKALAEKFNVSTQQIYNIINLKYQNNDVV